MIGGITGLLSNPTLTRVAQSTTSAVSIETGLKAVGRPSFILADGKIEPQTKRYAAMKEFLYQATCLAVYAALIVPLFKNGAFKLAQKMFDAADVGKFRSNKQYNHYLKLCETTPKNRALTLDKEIKGTANSQGTRTVVSEKYDQTILEELKKDKPNQFPVLKGAVELGNIIGSVFGLAIFAPQVSHAFIHPAMRFLGLEDENGNKKPSQKQLDKTV